ncbi:MAG: ATP-binding cassette domain-containing protein [Clostridia bacterium]|nr:ATP-binding cassette domain-containing protein [Clostridia bacterium]
MDWLKIPYEELRQQFPVIEEFFTALILEVPRPEETKSLEQIIQELDHCHLNDLGLIRQELPQQAIVFLENIQKQLSAPQVSSITLIGGQSKSGQAENLNLRLQSGEIIALVGATGAGKSRLLADIEWMAQGDTPTGRRILINDQVPLPEWRYSIEHKLVAQLSQNMNFVMDLSVADFLELHGRSRLVPDLPAKIEQILAQANQLAGEPLSREMPVTALSGGQSRALMIADTAFLSLSPIVLIDEIENAGIDRRQAIKLLLNKNKIVLIATHDPILALMADKRLVLQNGAIAQVLTTSAEERAGLIELERMNQKLLHCREKLRQGFSLTAGDF